MTTQPTATTGPRDETDWQRRERQAMERLIAMDAEYAKCRCPILSVGDFCPVHQS